MRSFTLKTSFEPPHQVLARRTFLRYLAASPLFASGALAPMRGILAAADAGGREAYEMGEIISSVNEAINIFDFHAVARKNLPPGHYGHLATGTDDDATLRANREGFRQFQLRMRRLIDVREIDTSVELFGTRYNLPIGLSPTGGNMFCHDLGEIAVARAAKETSILYILGIGSTVSIEDVTRERGEPVWFQFYPGEDWSLTTAVLRRVEQAGCPVLTLTVDSQGGSNRETRKRITRMDERDCTVCHDPSEHRHVRKPMLGSLDLARYGRLSPRDMTWEFVRRLKEATSMKLFLKGIVTWEDAELCLEHGVDGLIVSNHGGRAEASGRGTIECLPEIVKVTNGRIPVLIDGGFRRGTDVFKALALGATAVCIGRPYLWGLAAFGQEGVQAVLNLMRAELTTVMRQAGTTSIDKISRNHILHAGSG